MPADAVLETPDNSPYAIAPMSTHLPNTGGQSSPGDITRLLAQLSIGDQATEEALFALVYSELHRIASAQMRRERPEHTLQATELLNEAYLRLCRQYQIDWQDRMHFYRVAARLMRRILVDHAKRRKALCHGGGQQHLQVSEDAIQVHDRHALTVEIDELLQLLARESPRLVQVVEMKFFAQLSGAEIADV